MELVGQHIQVSTNANPSSELLANTNSFQDFISQLSKLNNRKDARKIRSFVTQHGDSFRLIDILMLFDISDSYDDSSTASSSSSKSKMYIDDLIDFDRLCSLLSEMRDPLSDYHAQRLFMGLRKLQPKSNPKHGAILKPIKKALEATFGILPYETATFVEAFASLKIFYVNLPISDSPLHDRTAANREVIEAVNLLGRKVEESLISSSRFSHAQYAKVRSSM
jgi:hypothetical protein